ncbi:MAG TPA: presqualene diphosphate synthase HpnD [Stellaceae bacterium]|jgi:phytoene synthase|nr:presqualene diphosphate synthase HpnD [Stellaceae bacterium]
MTDAVSDGVGALPDDDALREIIRQRVEAAGTSFYWAMRLLPPDRRNGMYAVYAFCREVDDIADDLLPPEQKKAGLATWHDEIEALYAGRPTHLVARALSEPVSRFNLRRDDFHAVIDGMEMDAIEDIRAPDLATLDCYCGRVAGAVGHLSVHVFGDASAAAHRVADALGRALQLTNILRDIDEDAQRGRLYLPREILDRHGIRGAEPLNVLRHPALPAVCRDVAAIAERHFADAAQAMAQCSRRAMRPAAVMGAFYRAMLDALLRDGWRDPGRRVSLSKPQKLWLVLRHGFL